jgi:hypothetical protein
MSDDVVHAAVAGWLASLTGRTVIKSYQSGPLPAKPFVMVNLTGTAEVREHPMEPEYTELNSLNSAGKKEIRATPVIEVEWRFSVHAYGANPTDLLRPIRSAAQLSQKVEPLLPALVIHEVSQIRHVPDFVNEDWEPRAQLDVIIRGLTRDGFVIDTIDETPVTVGRLSPAV